MTLSLCVFDRLMCLMIIVSL